MNDKEYNNAIKFFIEDCEVDERVARQMAGAADNIICNVNKMSDTPKLFNSMVLLALRNAFFLGQENN